MRTLSTSIALAAALGVAAPAAAQAYGCVAPPGLTAPPPAAQDAPTVRSPIAGYTMAISWSPEFCRGGAASAPDNAGQCARGATRFGFALVVTPVVRQSLIADASGDRLDAVLCLVQAAVSSRRPRFGLPPDVDAVEGWIVEG